ncbi:hypothetical protein CWI84_10190 [Idiomarina tyrosinivorans]|uniref:Uncharacterized protein n=1 Tax=Idiomarina tyrosinivorans TaxID=1445662 RepID=A0A432ZLR6_9GAMM|nr:DUF5916 domain-containing protein [Idiomarina tyrosinivorans]RUO78909.1 hypothetical protein CWI84_10190 [Idiomarina tyrosinivorans]
MRRIWLKLVFDAFLAGISLSAAAQPPNTKVGTNNASPRFSVPKVQLAPTIDGRVNPDEWQNARHITLDYETKPAENQPAPVTTDAYILQSGNTFYVGFIAHDPNPEDIRAVFRERDGGWNDDMIGVKLDTFNQQQLAYQFYVNPLGVQTDVIENELSGDENSNWDAIWDSAGRITANGYQVEMAIPLAVLNFDDTLAQQTWGFDLIRFYPRDSFTRIALQPNDRDNVCQLCQLAKITGFKNAQQGTNLIIAPTLTAIRNEQRDAYDPNSDFDNESDVEAGLDVRWNITPDIKLNATLNPDFSQVEADSAQLDVNETFALFYDEKRPFFTADSDYFDSQMDVIYSRNIGSPDYGAKLTGRYDKQTFAGFVANDAATAFLVPGNRSSDLAVIDEKSKNAALRYRYDVSDSLSIGTVATARDSEQYHNYNYGIDARYRPSATDTWRMQWMQSDTRYPDWLKNQFCYGDPADCQRQAEQADDCDFGNCPVSEQYLRTEDADGIKGNAYTVRYRHQQSNYVALAEYYNYGRDYRADLGFMSQIDMEQGHLGAGYFWYGDSQDPYTLIQVISHWRVTRDQDGTQISDSKTLDLHYDGPLQSALNLGFENKKELGERYNQATLTLANNAPEFDQNIWHFAGSFKPFNGFYLGTYFEYGDSIDYYNNQLGTVKYGELSTTWNVSERLTFSLFQQHESLDVDGGELYRADLTDFRVSYHFSVRSYLKLALIYNKVERNPALYRYYSVNRSSEELSSQLLYTYKVNPRTLLYLGYSDNAIANDYISDLRRNNKTYFMKVSYAWQQ